MPHCTVRDAELNTGESVVVSRDSGALLDNGCLRTGTDWLQLCAILTGNVHGTFLPSAGILTWALGHRGMIIDS